MLNLDALKPKTIDVLLNGQTYRVPTQAGLPLSASLDIIQAQQMPPGPEQVKAMTDFITRYTSLPVLDMTGAQVSALFAAMFGGNEAPATADPQRPPTDPLKPTLPEMSPEKAAIIEKYRGKVLVP